MEEKRTKTEERTLDATVHVIRLHCLKDDTALEFTGKTVPVNPPKYEYQCPVCKHKELSVIQYPQIVYKERRNE